MGPRRFLWSSGRPDSRPDSNLGAAGPQQDVCHKSMAKAQGGSAVLCREAGSAPHDIQPMHVRGDLTLSND